MVKGVSGQFFCAKSPGLVRATVDCAGSLSYVYLKIKEGISCF